MMIHDYIFRVFLTFDNADMANQAQIALDGNEEGWRTTFSRRPPPSKTNINPSSTSRNQPPPKDFKRSLVTYDDIFE